MNLAIMCGRLTKEPESKTTQTGTNMTRYSIAVDRRNREETDYFNILAFGKAADFAKNYFHQGMRVLIQGHIQTNSYINRDGIKVNSFDIVADNQEFADGKQGGGSRVRANEDEFMSVPADDDYGIPF